MFYLDFILYICSSTMSFPINDGWRMNFEFFVSFFVFNLYINYLVYKKKNIRIAVIPSSHFWGHPSIFYPLSCYPIFGVSRTALPSRNDNYGPKNVTGFWVLLIFLGGNLKIIWKMTKFHTIFKLALGRKMHVVGSLKQFNPCLPSYYGPDTWLTEKG